MIPGGKTGKRSTLLIVLALVGALAVIAGVVELVGTFVPSPERPARAVDPGEAAAPVVPQVVKIDDHTVEIRLGFLHRNTIRRGDSESIDPLVDCLREGIERVVSEMDPGEQSAPRRGWLSHDPLSLRMNDAVKRVQTECLVEREPSLRPLALREAVEGLDPDVLQLALAALESADELHDVRPDRLTIIDYSLPSTEKRLWVLDPETGELLFHELVAHGKNSGENVAETFSNEPGSLASSLGTFLTAGTYQGKHGYSLKLEGLEPGINDNAMERLVVVHGADYVSAEYAASHGRLGRSWGCPAVRVDVAEQLIDSISGGSVLFVYHSR
jgi:hypothetical protein